jgi:hypothetical protein
VRRRIYIAPDGSGLEDVTGRPYLYEIDRDLALGALYDDPIWTAYLAAREAFAVLERAVIGHLRGEPYDDVERRAAEEASALLDADEVASEIKVPKMDEIAARVLAHAAEIYGNGDAPR